MSNESINSTISMNNLSNVVFTEEELKLIPLTRSTQQYCNKCSHCCPEYGQKSCQRCDQKFENHWYKKQMHRSVSA